MPRILHADSISGGIRQNERNDFQNLEPISEAHRTSFFRRSGKWPCEAIFGLTLAVTPAIASGIITSGCSHQQEQKQVTANVGQTDSDGTATFNINNWEFNINVYDSTTLNPIPNLAVIFTANEGNGDYLILDPNNAYLPTLGGASGVQVGQTSKLLHEVGQTSKSLHELESLPGDRNVLLDPPSSPLCGLSIGGDAWQDIIINYLLPTFFTLNQSSVKLSDLDNVMTQIADVTSGEVGGEVAGKAVVAALPFAGVSQAATKAADTFLGEVGVVLLALQACADSQTLAYGNYYRSLCYTQDSTFSIYTLQGIKQIEDITNAIPGLNYLIGVKTPFFVIVPDISTPNPSYAIFNAQTYIPSGDSSNPWITFYDIAKTDSYQVDSVNMDLPPLLVDEYVPDSGTLEMALNACSNLNPTYTISAPLSPYHIVPDPQLPYEQATSDPISVTGKDDYGVVFYLQKPDKFAKICPNGYQTYYKPASGTINDMGGAHHELAVACSAPDGYTILGIDGGIDASSKDAGVFDANAVVDVRADSLDASPSYSCWYRLYQSAGKFYSAEQTHDGGYILVGVGPIIKTDPQGNEIWSYSVKISDSLEPVYGILETNDGSFVAFGDAGLTKLDQNGTLIWNNPIGGCMSMAGLADGSYVVETIAVDGHLLHKISQDGGEVWKQSLWPDSSGMHTLNSHILTIEDGIIIIGSYANQATLRKTDLSGNTLWTKTYDLGLFDSITKLSDGGFAIGGIGSSADGSSGDVLVNLSSNGDVRWEKPADGPYSLFVTKDNDFVLTDSRSIFTYDPNGTLIREVNALAVDISCDLLGGPSLSFIYSIRQTTDEGLILAGQGVSSGSDVGILIKLPSNNLVIP